MTVKEQAIRALWQEVFHDDERFVELLFAHLYRDENAIGIEQDGQWIAALQMLPYRFLWSNSLLDVAYISGAATRPQYRNQGYMSQLLTRAFDEMKARHIPLSVLVPAEPWLYDFYAARGYAPLFFREERCYDSAHRFEAKGYHWATFTREELFAFFEEQMLSRPLCMQHSRADFEVVCGDVELEGGAVFSLADEAGCLVALSFSVCRDNEVLVKELLATTAEAEVAMLRAVQTRFPGKSICRYLPATEQSRAVRHGMMRIVDVETVLSRFAEDNRSLSMTIRVVDADLPHNTGDYRLAHGVCHRESIDTPDYNVDIVGLATLLFTQGKSLPYMSLMLD